MIIQSKTPLCLLFEEHFSDKCPSVFHSYSPAYYDILKVHQVKFTNILEIGIGSYAVMSKVNRVVEIENTTNKKYRPGASLRAWRDFFTNAQVYGADIDKSVLFKEDRIQCFYVDQSIKQSLQSLINEINTPLDLIIDDGSHLVPHMLLTIQTIACSLTLGGIYIIEDVRAVDLEFFSTLQIENLKVTYTHKGEGEWDSFVCYQRVS